MDADNIQPVIEYTALKSALFVLTASMGTSVSPEVFLGSLLLALFGAALGAIWIEHASMRERLLSVAAGIFGALLVVIGHEEFLSSWPVQFKALVAGLVGRHMVALIMQGAKQVASQSASIINHYLEKLGTKDE